MGGASLAQRAQEVRVPRNRAGCALHRLDQHGGKAVRILSDQACRLFRVVIGRDEEGKGMLIGALLRPK